MKIDEVKAYLEETKDISKDSSEGKSGIGTILKKFLMVFLTFPQAL